MDRKRRQEIINDLIRSKRIASQSELVARLRELGVEATQASISRDLLALHIVKSGGFYRLAGRGERGGDLRIRSAAAAGPNLIVFKCDPGLASAITVQIDASQINGVVGTIAGDDTIFVAVADSKVQGSVSRTITEAYG